MKRYEVAARLLGQLIDPPAGITSREKRRRVRLLSAILLPLIALHLISIIVLLLFGTPLTILDGIVLFSLIAAYLIGRTGYFHSASLLPLLTMFALFLSPLVTAIFAAPTNPIANIAHIITAMVWAVTIGYLLITPVQSVVFFVFNLALFVLLPLFVPYITPDILATIVYLVLGQTGMIIGATVIGRDDLRLMEAQAEQISERETLLRGLLETLPEGISILRDKTAVFVNPAMERITGYPKEKLYRMTYLDLLSDPHTAAQVAGDLSVLLRAGRIPDQMEISIRHADGSERWLECKGKIITYEGSPAVMISAYDITERKRVEIALRTSEAHAQEQRQIAETLRDTIAALNGALDLQSVFSRIFDNASRVIPCDAMTIMLIQGDEAHIMYERNHAPQTIKYYERYPLRISNVVLRTILDSHQPFVIRDTAKEPGWVAPPEAEWIRSYLGVPIVDQDRVIGVLNMDSRTPNYFVPEHAERFKVFAAQAAIALSNAQAYEQMRQQTAELEKHVAIRTAELRAAYERLQELDRLKTKFIADISHELRTPISTIDTRLYLLSNDRPEKHGYHMETLRQQFARLKTLLNDILDFSTFEHLSQRTVRRAMVDINKLVLDCVEMAKLRPEAASLSFSTELKVPLKQVRGSPELIERIVLNLLNNAIKYAGAGSVTVRTSEEQAGVCLDVEDHGPGIAPEDLPHLFERFYRGRNVGSSNIPGAGLGLAIVKDLVDLHQGEVRVFSEQGKGSRFHVWLPLQATDHHPNPDSPDD